ncbi:TetR/AcrR family transcriptional regulator [Massilia sp. TW-1]|uniref:TetR/AcrR family transcriptional regulator n=1 Tax=Telluria antibiotica TaxID=2717319 RepID=A0ABX0PE23_9BURK|nr:TetR/AcrR family transcriptional regulator [Telluria antibiotica]NIA54759.1 TetR/AcrR family transcriptional regulator [Telluria antibiotica]
MSVNPNKPTGQTRDRQQTEAKLRLALKKLRERGAKVSISGIAKEAGVSSALIHNRYPSLAEEVRIAVGKDIRSQRNKNENLLIQERAKNQALRVEVANLRKEIIDLASINEALRAELTLQSAISTGKVSKLPS